MNSLIKKINTEIPGLIPDDKDIPMYAPIEENALDKNSVSKIVNQKHLINAVQPLLEESSTLLSRCLSNRRYKYELEEKALYFWLNHRREKLIVENKQKAIDSGKYDIPIQNAEDKKKTLTAESPIITDALKNAKSSIEQRDTSNSQATNRVNISGELTSYLARTAATRTRELAEEMESIRLNYEVPSAHMTSNEWAIKQLQNEKDTDTIKRTLPYLQIEKSLNQELLDIDIDNLDLKNSASVTSGSALNYKERIIEVQKLFDYDYASAVSRCIACSDGLKTIFNRNAPLPSLTDTNTLSALLVWVREQLEYLSSLSENSLQTKWTQNIRDLITASDWHNLADSQAVKVLIPKGAFITGEAHIRSIRMYVEGMSRQYVGKCLITAPSLYVGEDKKSRTILIGDIFSSDISNETGIYESRNILNRTPFGEWSLEFSFSSSLQLNDIKNSDVFLEFELEIIEL